jgi:hypothetical protein
MAFFTSTGVRLKLFNLAGSSQIRIAYCAPKTWKSPTPAVCDLPQNDEFKA